MTTPSSRALITGASSGLGRALAMRMARRGVEVWVAARRVELLETLVREIESSGGRAHAVVLDVGAGDAAHDAVAALDASVGGFDVVVANAGVGGKGVAVSRINWSDASRVFQVDLVGALATLLAPLPRMLKEKRGHLVAISSLAGEIVLPLAPDYGAAKAALSFFMKAALMDLPGQGIDVTLVHPGFVRTEMTAKNRFPMPFLLEVDDAARIIDEGIQRKQRVLRFPFGLALVVGLGRFLPAWLVRILTSRSAE